jgi:hypothetical protein
MQCISAATTAFRQAVSAVIAKNGLHGINEIA